MTLAEVQAAIDKLERHAIEMLRPWMLAHYDENGDQRAPLPTSR